MRMPSDHVSSRNDDIQITLGYAQVAQEEHLYGPSVGLITHEVRPIRNAIAHNRNPFCRNEPPEDLSQRLSEYNRRLRGTQTRADDPPHEGSRSAIKCIEGSSMKVDHHGDAVPLSDEE